MRKFLDYICDWFRDLFCGSMKIVCFRLYLRSTVLIYAIRDGEVLYYGDSRTIPESLYDYRVLSCVPSHDEMGTYLELCVRP